MPLKYFCPLWGNKLSFNLFCKRVKEAGYDGIEMALPFDTKEKQKILNLLEKYELNLIGQYWQSTEKNFSTHAKNYAAYLYHLASVKPILINAQTGKDYFSFEQNMQLVKIAESVSSETGIEILHETHRGKFLFNIPIFEKSIAADEKLKITLDISHWCNVHESFLDDQPNGVALALKNTRHLHARIGHTQSAQVNDPRAPEWKPVLNKHLEWWDKVIMAHLKKKKQFTITPEFGPLPYMPATPYKNKPLANQWDLNYFMLQLLKKRYGAKSLGI